MDNFTQASESIADKFLQTIIFIDDEAYPSTGTAPTGHEFDAQEVSKCFYNSQKICAVYKPEIPEDMDKLYPIALKADVTVLDWKLNLTEISNDDSTSDDEDDDDIDDHRGQYTKPLINKLLSSPESQNSLKLIVIYTGEIDLEGIAREILLDLNNSGLDCFQISENDTCTVLTDNCRISIISKSNLDSEQPSHNPILAQRRVTPSELPSFITSEFTKLTKGLLSNFALQSLTEIRKNYHQILKIFSGKLDSAYLGHQSLLPNIDDANELLVGLLGDTFVSILRDQGLNSSINEAATNLWIEEYINEKEMYLINSKGNNTNIKLNRSRSFVKALLQPNLDVEDKFKLALSGNIDGTLTSYKNYITKHTLTLFSDASNLQLLNQEFAKLCQHKNLLVSSGYIPTLTLGTVVKSSSDAQYYVCIQQRCDSVRLTSQESRRFLFLPLTVISDSSSFSFLTPDNIKLKLQASTYGVRTIKFNGSDSGVVKAISSDEQLLFTPTHHSQSIPEVLKYVFELKELYAQEIIGEYSSNLSRVALDKPEWLRRLN